MAESCSIEKLDISMTAADIFSFSDFPAQTNSSLCSGNLEGFVRNAFFVSSTSPSRPLLPNLLPKLYKL